jgi:acyl-coenzyme A thioesterase PaaI-like protein
VTDREPQLAISASLDREVTLAVAALRDLQDAFARCGPDEVAFREATRQLRALTSQLDAHAEAEARWVVGRLPQAGRGQAMSPVVELNVDTATEIRAQVILGDFYHGKNGAAHGGAVALLMDEVLGQMAHRGNRGEARTAYLKVDYRNIARVNRRLNVHAWLDRQEGRKIYVRAVVHDSETLVADGEALFVTLLAGQQ